jgi:DNA-binding transcriptional ArsR family regulator
MVVALIMKFINSNILEVAMTGYEPQAKLFKVLMHPARLAILEILREDEECVCHMEYLLGYRQAYISQQLSVLRENGLVQDRRDGLNIFYSSSRPGVYELIDQATRLTGMDSPPGRVSRKSKTRAGDCPCPKCSHTNVLIVPHALETR